MAKRKRLGMLSPETGRAADDDKPVRKGAIATGLRPPIAQVAGDSAAVAALGELSEVLVRAEEEGRMVRVLDLDQIDTGFLVRDRLQADDEAMAALKESLTARGQQTPIEVQSLPGSSEGTARFGLISGWRRVLALRGLFEKTGAPRFARVLALVRQPESLADSYVAMVEENEIRAGLSYFERARIVAKALEVGVYDTEKAALQSLFSSASYARRSKIKSFLPVVAALDGVVQFPAALTERDGLALSKALGRDPDLGERLRRGLADSGPRTAETERAMIQDLQKRTGAAARPGRKEKAPGVSFDRAPVHRISPQMKLRAVAGRLELTGAGVDDAFCARLEAWLRGQAD
ncbi:ParB N-terminal domain-containing protein [Oceaniglobus trochenteri]|uniref:ParB N-terminal domain-containing protein n=1 Tax=Oceaniglobus trochenteri TaxID=2763260 RepID=UPI001CFF69C3|nr:ParB N-terminal domain-containing protein [Oceaniglobus trochenteri]